MLWISIDKDAITTTDPRNTISWRHLSKMSYIAAAGLAAVLVGIYKILRGIGILKR